MPFVYWHAFLRAMLLTCCACEACETSFYLYVWEPLSLCFATSEQDPLSKTLQRPDALAGD